MCGIAGIVASGRANVRALDVVNDLQRHRGPDGAGTWRSSSGRCALGHRRLAILDLSAGGRQPMVHAERDLAITYNGEIYNYLELRRTLQELGHRFQTESDTEVLLHAYAAWGERCVERLNGMFAFAVWDEREQTLFCARDRFGEKPFTFGWAGDAFVFASEAKAVVAFDGVDDRVDDGVLAAFVDDGSTAIDGTERTLLRGVRQLLPAHAMRVRVDEGRVSIERTWEYWSVDTAARRPYGADAPERAGRELLDLLTDSVRLRLRSDVPVGSCLSGGLDSSAIVSLVRRLEPDADLRTFTGRFPGDPLDEGKYAHMVVAAVRASAREVTPSAERFAADAASVYWHAEFPIGGMSQFAQWCVFHLASENGVTVLLDGQGSDEQLGGYGSGIVVAFLAQLAAERRWGAWLHERRLAARAQPALFAWSKLALGLPGVRRVRPLLRASTGRSVVGRESLFRADWLAEARAERPAVPGAAEDGSRDHLSRLLFQLSFRTMLSSLLRFGDRLSMAHSREVRLPFCDHRVAELAFALAPELLVGDGQVKRVLRLAIRGLVPDAIVTRPKQGFVPPQARWLTGPLAGWVREVALAPGPIRDRLAGDRASALLDAPEASRAREADRVWDLANLGAWSAYGAHSRRSGKRLAPQSDAGAVDAVDAMRVRG